MTVVITISGSFTYDDRVAIKKKNKIIIIIIITLYNNNFIHNIIIIAGDRPAHQPNVTHIVIEYIIIYIILMKHPLPSTDLVLPHARVSL